MNSYFIDHLNKDLNGVVITPNNDLIVIPFSLPEEEISIQDMQLVSTNKKLNTHIYFATQYTLLKTHPLRVEPWCPYYTQCGGCNMQHMSLELYKYYKVHNLHKLLAKANIYYTKDINLITQENHGINQRRKAEFSVDGKKIGFKQYKSNKTIHIKYCPLISQAINQLIPLLQSINHQHYHILKLTSIRIIEINQQLIILLSAKTAYNSQIATILTPLYNAEVINQLYWQYNQHIELLIQRNHTYLSYGKTQIALKPTNFIQPNAELERYILEYIVQYTHNSQKILNLFCGLGSYALYLASIAHIQQITCYDIDNMAVDSINQLKHHKINAKIQNLFTTPLLNTQLSKFDTIILNPPRKGAFQQIQHIQEHTIQNIILIYCSATSLVRDLQIILQSNFKIINITVIDQFAYNKHIEILVYLQSQK